MCWSWALVHRHAKQDHFTQAVHALRARLGAMGLALGTQANNSAPPVRLGAMGLALGTQANNSAPPALLGRIHRRLLPSRVPLALLGLTTQGRDSSQPAPVALQEPTPLRLALLSVPSVAQDRIPMLQGQLPALCVALGRTFPDTLRRPA